MKRKSILFSSAAVLNIGEMMLMSNSQKRRLSHDLKRIYVLCTGNKFRASRSNIYVDGSCQFPEHIRFYSKESGVNFKRCGNLRELAKKSRVARSQVQDALLDYFHGSRGLPFMDAENMSKNSPEFLECWAERVHVVDVTEVRRSVTRFLRYHPINEFEPFFESIGLKRSEYLSFLPPNMIFLSDDHLFLENYCVLHNYGIERNRIGKIYKEATEVFWYKHGVLPSKLRSFQDLGLKVSLVAKVIASTPHLLVGNVDPKLIEVLDKLKKVGIDYDWLEQHISMDNCYDWKHMMKIMCLFTELGLTDEQIQQLLTKHSHLLLECSGHMTFSVFGFLIKFGSTWTDVQNVFLQFPDISIMEFANNAHCCYRFLVEINMDSQDIGWIVRSYPTLLGSCKPRNVKYLLNGLNCGKSMLLRMVKDDPYVLKKWVLGVKVTRLQEGNRVLRAKMLKTKFLLSLGFVEKSKEMERILKLLCGRGVELQERFDCLVNIGLSREEVIRVIRVFPQVFGQSKDVIETKVGIFVDELGFPVSDLLTYPKLISYTIPRLKLRLLTYKWLKDEGAVRSKLPLSSLLSCSDEIYVKTYVNSHPKGPEFWKRQKQEILSD